MNYLPRLFESNKRWAQQRTEQDPRFFSRLCDIQRPEYLWVGCADSRVPANEIVGLDPGEMFVHRNIANVVVADDPNALSVIQYAIQTLQIRHIIVCGHYGCGGVAAALDRIEAEPPLRDWLEPVRALAARHAAELDALPDRDARWRRLCELNVIAQVRIVADLEFAQRVRDSGQHLTVHGWIYDLSDGLLRDLGVSVDLVDASA